MTEPLTTKQRAVVICPGRGTYNKDELGYFHRYHSEKLAILKTIDQYRVSQGQVTVAELDQMAQYSMRLHTAGENASSLIYACSAGDFSAIDTEQYDIVAVTGNSMGWYIALAVAGALNSEHAITLINTMGSMMAGGVIGGQLIYPITNTDWQIDHRLVATIEQWLVQVNQLPETEVYISIKLGGYLVLGGNKAGLQAMTELLPNIDDRYPMNLFNHAAFHTPLMNDITVKAQQLLPPSLFEAPQLPLIDGQGKIWQPHSADLTQLYQYTLGTQVNCAYDYSKAIEVAVKEFAPDKLIILGPGATLGGATAQALIAQQWQSMNNKQDFITRQQQDPFVLAMGMPEQRALVVGH
jgi:[acyl-carrier-protein] S-malonyltransferase